MLLDHLAGFRLRYHAEHLACATTLRQLSRVFGEIADPEAARHAVEHRNRQVADAFTTRLLPHTGDLLDLARSGLAMMPPAPHHAAWRLLLDDLDHATDRIHHHLKTDVVGRGGDRCRADAQVWPYLTTWAEHALTVRDLAAQHRAAHIPVLLAAEQERLTALALDARTCGQLEPFESWYDAAGRRITLAYLIEDDDSTILVLAGDVAGEQMTVLGQYDNEYGAGRCSPPPVPTGVLRPDAPWGPERAVPDSDLGVLIQGVIDSHHSGDVAAAIAAAVETDSRDRGPLPMLDDFLRVCAEFADALDTPQGHKTATRLNVLAAHVHAITRELRAAGEELGKHVAVLPPQRVPHPRHIPAPPGPAPDTALPPGRLSAPAVPSARTK
ncbi:hypothetical protein [Streptomyces sp. HPF1205]|uniref:hypothetical protein n=1 Tax=Streptomyces sp. HPF1205 TaxID=2873262 RepID=UPI001CEDAF6E|nr:hypothetical protein [Streptomyces sp. HPF1205]